VKLWVSPTGADSVARGWEPSLQWRAGLRGRGKRDPGFPWDTSTRLALQA